MDKKFTNKIVSVDNIIYIADLMHRHDSIYDDVERKEKQKKEEAQARDEHYYMKSVFHEFKTSITFNKNEEVTKSDNMGWFVETLKSNPKEISSISLHYYASVEGQRETTDIYFYPNKIDLDSSSTNMSSNQLAEQIEQYINGLPARYDDTIVKDNRRTMIPALSVSIPIGLIVAFVLLFLCKFNVISGSVVNFLSKGYVLAGIFAILAFFGMLIIPTQNNSLYRHIKFETYYAGYDEKNYKSIYKNDYADFKNKCEVEIGENVNMPIVRRKINVNYKRAIKIVGIELIVSIIGIVLFFVL